MNFFKRCFKLKENNTTIENRNYGWNDYFYDHGVYFGGQSLISIFDFNIILFDFLLVDLFDTLGVLIGVSEKAGFLDKKR